MKPAMSDFVDRRCLRVPRMMSNAESEITKREPIGVTDKAKDHAELAIGRWQIDLQTAGQPGAVAAFGIATAKCPDLEALSLESTSSLPQRTSACATAPHRVLGERALVEENTGIAPPNGQELPLAVGGLKWPVLGL
jgi:hypothetical protein